MEPLHFGERVGYLRWLKHLVDGSPPTFRAIGEAVGRHSVTVSDWLAMERFPNVRDLDAALATYFSAPATWITDGEGEPPMPELWKVWTKVRRAERAAAGVPLQERATQVHPAVVRAAISAKKARSASKGKASRGGKG